MENSFFDVTNRLIIFLSITSGVFSIHYRNIASTNGFWSQKLLIGNTYFINLANFKSDDFSVFYYAFHYIKKCFFLKVFCAIQSLVKLQPLTIFQITSWFEISSKKMLLFFSNWQFLFLSASSMLQIYHFSSFTSFFVVKCERLDYWYDYFELKTSWSKRRLWAHKLTS